MKSMWVRLVGSIVCVSLLSGCIASRVTTTPQTAVEQALLSKAISDAVHEIDIDQGRQQKVYIDDQHLYAETCGEKKCMAREAVYALSLLKELLLNNEYVLAKDLASADVVVTPRIDFAAIDDSESLLGFPEIPVPVPGVGVVSTPSIALFESLKQKGRAKVSLVFTAGNSGEFQAVRSGANENAYYTRWGVLFLFKWRTTSLEGDF